MSEQESKLPAYIDYPYDRFLKLRIEFLILTQNDLKARIMRVIERCVENERQNYYRYLSNRTPTKNTKIVLPDNIFAAISHKFFIDELWGVVQSETTLRDALKELEDDHLIIRRPGGTGPYDPPLYILNKPLINHLFTLLPPLDEIDMISLMKQPRRKKNEDGSYETGPIINPLARLIRGTITGPLDPQLLDPYTSIIGPLSSTGGVQKLDPIRYKEITEENKENMYVSDKHETPTSLENLSLEELQAEITRRQSLQEQPAQAPTENAQQISLPGIKPTVPEMPAANAPWPSPEVAVQIVEAKLGNYYREAARAKELSYARRMFKEDPDLTREQFVAAYDKRDDDYWHEKMGKLHLHHMVEKDRVHDMLDKILAAEQKKSRQKSGNSQQPQFYAAAALKERAQRDIQSSQGEQVEGEERLSEAELAAYMRLVK